ncbi:type VI secretion system baseplate subunit TssK [Roseospira navarrensis]|uniref:Type VI secretion system baseplate subunit TssK n=1 Tax=Roseospira navarrensis TaxID=140058 RepID=A0A7X1ZCB1_9PROT|nr:type VI secretion system baseplate subunit TssK [Roseospira navarrensis]MQX35938.1 type VI secretion system baseplate subunit TssK [Roseospira navarrensis]
MGWRNRVVWSEGMFLRAQHFQQADRAIESLIHDRTMDMTPHPWGISALSVDAELLETGKFAVTECRGVLPDGTPFAIPDEADAPPPLELTEGARGAEVFLTLPLRRPGLSEVAMDSRGEATARYMAADYEALDTIAGSDVTADVQVARQRLRYKLEGEDRAGYASLGLARIVEVDANGRIRLDPAYIPPTLVCRAARPLFGFLTELQGLLHHRGEALAARLGQSGTKGVAEIADFLLLQATNRYEPLLAHWSTGGDVHPERFYALCLEMAGELSTFAAESRRPARFPPYQHDDLQGSFTPVIADLRMSLSAVLEQTATQLELRTTKSGVLVWSITDRSLLHQAVFVLAVRAEVSTEVLRRHFPHQVKIGPVEDIRQLVNSALPGIDARPLAVAPRQIPYHADYVYFELDKSGDFWRRLSNSGGMGIHIGGDFPNVDMELWAIRQ